MFSIKFLFLLYFFIPLSIIPNSIILMSIISPFKFGKVVIGEYFINRKKEIKRINSNIRSNINTIIISPRRWGKSSLMKQIASGWYNGKNKFVFIDFCNIRSEEDFYKIYSQEILKSTLSKTDEFLKAGKKFFKRIIPQITFSIDPQQDLSLGFNWNEVIKAKDEIINLPEKIAIDNKIQITICIDEFQNIAKIQDYIRFQEELRAYWQNHQHVSYCLYGSKKHMMLDIFNQESHPFYRFGDLIMMDKIPEEEWKTFIIQSFSKTNRKISPVITDKIIEITNNHPDYIQQLCHHTWNLTETEVEENILNSAIELVLRSNVIFYRDICENLSNTQINLLKAIINGETKLTSAKVMQFYKLGTPRNVSKNKRVLETKDIIDIRTETVYFADPFFEYWFKKTFIF